MPRKKKNKNAKLSPTQCRACGKSPYEMYENWMVITKSPYKEEDNYIICSNNPACFETINKLKKKKKNDHSKNLKEWRKYNEQRRNPTGQDITATSGRHR